VSWSETRDLGSLGVRLEHPLPRLPSHGGRESQSETRGLCTVSFPDSHHTEEGSLRMRLEASVVSFPDSHHTEEGSLGVRLEVLAESP